MDWAAADPAAADDASELAPLAPMDDGSALGLLPGPPPARAGRRISHKKSASDTFAFAAGLFQQEDFYHSLMEMPGDALGRGQQFSGSSSRAGLPPTSPLRVLDAATGAGEGKSASFDNLRVQVPADASGISSSQVTGTPGSSKAAATSAGHMCESAFTQHAAAAAAAAAAAPLEPPAKAKGGSKSSKGSKAAAAAAAAAAADAEAEAAAQQTRANALDPASLDPRRAKRILANRQSAQRSRMKRLQYIHDLEARSAAAAAGVKERAAELQRLQQQQASMAEAMEAGKAQVASLAQQLAYEQALQATLAQHVASLRSRAAAMQQQQPAQQQLQQWPQQQQQQQVRPQQPAGAYAPPQQQVQQHPHQQQQVQMPYIKPEPDGHTAAAAYAAGVFQQQQYAGALQQQQQQYQQQTLQPSYQAAARAGNPSDVAPWQQQQQQLASQGPPASAPPIVQRHSGSSSRSLPQAPGAAAEDVAMDSSEQQQQQQQAAAGAAAAVGAPALLVAPSLTQPLPAGNFPDLGAGGLTPAGSSGAAVLPQLSNDEELAGLLAEDEGFLYAGPSGELLSRDEMVMGSLIDLRKTSSL